MHLFLQVFHLFSPGFILVSQMPMELAAATCVYQSLTETVFMAVFLPCPDLLLAKNYSPRFIKLNFKKNACLVEEYHWGYYQGKAV